MPYVPPPGPLPPGRPGIRKARRKGRGKRLRPRWKDDDHIYEWDGQKAELEQYDFLGKHQGAFDWDTGRRLKPADPTRTVEP